MHTTISRQTQVGIYERCAYTARIYPDRAIITSPYIHWIGNSGGLDERKERITNPAVLAEIRACLADGAEDSAWAAIGRALDDEHLMQSGL